MRIREVSASTAQYVLLPSVYYTSKGSYRSPEKYCMSFINHVPKKFCVIENVLRETGCLEVRVTGSQNVCELQCVLCRAAEYEGVVLIGSQDL